MAAGFQGLRGCEADPALPHPPCTESRIQLLVMAVQPSVGPGQVAPADPALTSWADDVDAPIRLGRFPCCGRYVCRCDEEDEEA